MTNFDNSDKLIKDLKERILALEVADRNYEMELQDREKTIEDQKNTIDLLSQIRKILIAENNELKDKAKEINKLQVEVNQKEWDICTLNETVDHKDHIIDRLNEEVKRLKLNPEIQDNNQMLVKFRRKLDQLKREILDLEKEFDYQLRGKYGT